MPTSSSRTVSGPAGVPSVAVTGALGMSSAGGDHVEKSCQPSLNEAPTSEAMHVPSHAETGAEAESRIAVASRVTSAPLSVANCVDDSVSGRFGVQAKPSLVPTERIAYVCADT